MVRGGPWSASFAFLMIALAGCSGLPFMEEDAGGSLVRIVEVDPSSMGVYGFLGANDPSDILGFAKTRFEYTHEGAAIDPSDATVRYTDEDGRSRSAPLSDFTSASSLGRGDRVDIEDVLLTSAIEIRDGDNVLASRGNDPVDWLEASGYPLPLAIESGAAAEWLLDGKMELDASFDHLEVVERGTDWDYVCEPYVYDGSNPHFEGDCNYQETPYTDTTRVDGFRANAEMDLDGVLRLAEVGSASRPRVELGLDGIGELGAFLDARVFNERTGQEAETTSGQFGFELEARADGDGAVRLGFGSDRQLRTVGGLGELLVTADLVAWTDEHPRSEQWRPEELPDPVLDVSAPYTEEDVPQEDPMDFVAEALAALWSMDLASGDEFRLDSEGFGAYMPSVSMLIRVVGEEETTVPAGTFDTWRVDTTMSLSIDTPAGDETFDFPPSSVWVDRESGLPVRASQGSDLEYSRSDLQSLLDLAEGLSSDDTSFDLPDDLSFSAKGSSVISLQELDGEIHMAPMASVLSPFMGLAVPLASAFYAPLGMLGAMGGFEDEWDEDAMAVPSISFSRDNAAQRVTVVMAESGILWSDLGADTDSSDCTVWMRFGDGATPYGDWSGQAVPVSAGDFLELMGSSPASCQGVELSIVHLPTNTLVYVATFT